VSFIGEERRLLIGCMRRWRKHLRQGTGNDEVDVMATSTLTVSKETMLIRANGIQMNYELSRKGMLPW
jgi:hypothetical protein